jgi:hypothetical protein
MGTRLVLIGETKTDSIPKNKDGIHGHNCKLG